ncbi:hypothetical protein GCM10018952_36990 [Streptosporangium vulgare]
MPSSRLASPQFTENTTTAAPAVAQRLQAAGPHTRPSRRMIVPAAGPASADPVTRAPIAVGP